MASPKQRDGRRRRAERSRLAVAEALLDLLNEGDPIPTAVEIADRAGLSLRTVHHHFRDREALFLAAARLQNQRTSHLIEPISPKGDLGTRLDAFVAQRSRLLEAVSPVRRAALAMARISDTIQLHLDSFRKLKREQLLQLFDPELSRYPRAARRALAAAACCAASWSAWEELRSNQGLSVAAARRLMRANLETLLLSWPRADSSKQRDPS